MFPNTKRTDYLQGENTYRILIVDDTAAHSSGIKQLLEIKSSHKIMGICSNGNEAIRRVNQVDVDLVLMDMHMPEMDGITTIQQLMIRKPNLKILALTAHDDPELIFKAMKAGARGYILKTMITQQLMMAVEEVMAGRIFLPGLIAAKFFDQFHARLSQNQTNDPQRQALLTYLTSREREVLKLLTEGITYKGVADRLVISETTVKTHVNNIFQKLQVNDRTQAVLYAIKHGLVDTPNPLVEDDAAETTLGALSS
jgi:two-component system, NarL family, response regulator DegU